MSNSNFSVSLRLTATLPMPVVSCSVPVSVGRESVNYKIFEMTNSVSN